MNFVSHVVLCAAQGGDDDMLLGSAAPDLVPRAGLSYADPLPASLAAGVEHHEDVDGRFHNHRWFLTHQSMAATSMMDRGVPRGPATLAGHVGIELLIDGALLSSDPRPRFWAMWERLQTFDESTRALVNVADLDRWSTWIRGFTSHIEPARYQDPEYCAGRIAGIVRQHTRMTMESEHESQIAAVLERLQPTIAMWAAGLQHELAMV